MRLIACLCLFTAGCATHYDQIRPVREAFYSGRLEEAAELLDKRKDLRLLRNHDVKQLDRAMIELAAGHPKQAEKILREVRDQFDKFKETSLLEEGASLLTDDNTRAYPGEDYERVLIRAMLAISNLMQEGGDAEAYALQMTDEQQQIIEHATEHYKEDPKAVLAYKQVALGPYIRAMLAEESPLTLDDAARARLQVAEWAPQFRDGKADLQRAKYERPLEPGYGTLYVFAMVGQGPVKEQVAEVATQLSLLVADRIVSNNSNRGLPPTLAPVWVPKVTTTFNYVDAISVNVGGRHVGKTATLVEVGKMAEEQHAAKYPYIIARAVARRVLKKGVIYGVKEGINSEPGTISSIALDAVGVVWEGTESADTRCWSLLPDKIQVLRVELPAGTHEVTLRGTRRDSTLGRACSTRVTIRDGHNSCLLGMFPETDLVGKLLVSGESTGELEQPLGQVRRPIKLNDREPPQE